MANQTGFDLSGIRSPFSAWNKAGRVLWAGAWLLLFRPSPRLLHGWRRLLLRTFRARIGEGARIDNTVRIWAPWNLSIGDHSAVGHHVDLYCLAPVAIGNNSIISQYAFVCTGSHDHTQSNFPVTSKPISVGDGVWIAADAFIGPGVTIGDGAVVGARASVFKSVAPRTIVGGNPARLLKERPMDEHGP